MRVLALGGTGAMGVHACRTIVEASDEVELVVTDLDAERAARIAEQVGDRADGVGLDVTHGRALAGALVTTRSWGPDGAERLRQGMDGARAAVLGA